MGEGEIDGGILVGMIVGVVGPAINVSYEAVGVPFSRCCLSVCQALGRRVQPTLWMVLGLTRSILRGRRDAVDDDDLHRSARWFEPQAQLLANRDSQRGQV